MVNDSEINRSFFTDQTLTDQTLLMRQWKYFHQGEEVCFLIISLYLSQAQFHFFCEWEKTQV